MSVLYGNEPAYDYAKENGDGNYPAGAVLYEVTWQLQQDEQWFGANVPKAIKTVERVEFYENNKKTCYILFEGKGLKKSVPIDEIKRVDFISGERMAVSP